MVIALLVVLIANATNCHLIIGRDLSQRKVFRTHSGGEFQITKPLSIRQRRMIARDLLKIGLAKMVAREILKQTAEHKSGTLVTDKCPLNFS